MKNNLFPIIAISILLFSACQEQNKGFIITANLKGFSDVPDSTLFYLTANGNTIDSTYVLNETFQLNGQVDKPTRGLVVSYKLREFISLWIENNEISIDGKKGDLVNAIVTGSKLNEEQNRLQYNTESLRKEEARLLSIYNQKGLTPKEKDLISIKSDSVRNLIGHITQEFITSNPNSLVSTNELNSHRLIWGKIVTQNLFNAMSSEMKSTEQGILIKEYLDKAINVSIGEFYTDFSQQDTKGNLITFSEVREDYTLIEFWGSWCTPCRKANPELIKIYNKFREKGFEIVGVATEKEKNNWLNAIEKDKLPWINLSDVNGDDNKVAVMYEVYRYPYNILIDKQGIIIAKKLNPRELEKKLNELLNEYQAPY